MSRAYWLSLARCWANLGVRDSMRGCLEMARRAPVVPDLTRARLEWTERDIKRDRGGVS